MSIERLGPREARAYAGPGEPARAEAAAGRSADASGRRRLASPPSPPRSAADQLSLSDAARTLAAARVAAAAPDVREERVAAIRQRLADGTYVVSPQALAQSMVEHALASEPLEKRGRPLTP